MLILGLLRWKRFKDMYQMLGWLILGATKTDYPDFTGRNYDYGIGVPYRLGGDFKWRVRPIFLLRHGKVWAETLNGNDALHRIMFTRARLNLPIFQFVGVGAEYFHYPRKSDYLDFPDVTQDTPELRLFLSWTP